MNTYEYVVRLEKIVTMKKATIGNLRPVKCQKDELARIAKDGKNLLCRGKVADMFIICFYLQLG
jgi:hypothetical protein